MTPIKPIKASGRMRPQPNESDEEDSEGRTDIEPIPPQPFAALLLQTTALTTTQSLAPQAPEVLAALSLTQPAMSRRPTLTAGAVPSAPRPFLLSQKHIGGPPPVALRPQGVAPYSTALGAPSATQPASRAESFASEGAPSATHPLIPQRSQGAGPMSVPHTRHHPPPEGLTLSSTLHTASHPRPPAPDSANPVRRPPGLRIPPQQAPGSASFNSLLRASRTALPVSESVGAIPSTQPSPLQPLAEGARPSPHEPPESQTHSLPPSRKIPDPLEALTRLQGRSDKPRITNDEEGLGSKTPAMKVVKGKYIYSPLRSHYAHLFLQ